MDEYKPNPINTENIKLNDSIKALTELLAKNTHENWAKQRIQDGWRHGAVRDDAKKEHPDLIPYEKLSDDEKAYDRVTAEETLKVILSLGFEITKQSDL